MNWFLDMCILIFYSEVGGKNYQKTVNFVEHKKDNAFIICLYVSKDNLPKWIKRQMAITNLVENKLSNDAYNLEESEDYRLLFPKDKIKLMKLLSIGASVNDKIKYIENTKRNQDIMFQRINYFLKNLIDKEVVPIKEIDWDLKSAIFIFTNNMSDSMTMASGIQYNQKENIILLTGDKHDWNEYNIKWVLDSEPHLAKKYAKIPEIRYIQKM